MAETIKLVQNDTGPQIQFTLSDESTGDPIDLTSATVVMRFREKDSDTTLFTRTCYIPNATAPQGIAYLVWDEGDLDQTPGLYEGEIEVTFPDTMRQTVYDIQPFRLRGEFSA